MRVEALALPGVLLLRGDVHRDGRGWLTELWQADAHAAAGLPRTFVQLNHARTVAGGLRGLHWQIGRPQGKLVSVVSGRIRDVVVDLRPESPTRLRSVVVDLEAGAGEQLWVPPGYAHGFLALGSTADVVYQFTEPWVPEAGRGVRWDDPDLAIRWGIEVPVVSAKDAALPHLRDLPPGDLP